MIGDTDLKISKLYDILAAGATSGDANTRTAADNQTVRKRLHHRAGQEDQAGACLPDDHGSQFPGNPARDRFATDDREASRRDAGRLESGR